MKKVIFLSVLFLFIPTMVLADAGGPSIIGYDAVVINKKGAKSQDEGDNKVIKYNTKIYVFDEYDNTVYACLDDDCSESVELKKSDVAPAKKEVTPNDFKKNTDDPEQFIEHGDKKIIINNKKGIKLKKGPADLYGNYDKVAPYRTIFNVHDYFVSYKFGVSFVYIDENGYKGWLDSENYLMYWDEEAITFENVKLRDIANNNEVTIPAETIIKGYYGNFYGEFYIQYNDQLLYGEDLSLGHTVDNTLIITPRKATIKSASGEKLGEIPSAEVLNVLFYCKDEYYYVEYNGIKGFITQKEAISFYNDDDEDNKKELDKETDFYDVSMYGADYDRSKTIDEFASKYKRIERIPKSATVYYYGQDYHYSELDRADFNVQLVTYKGKIGCIISIEKTYDNEPTPTPEPSTGPIVTIPPSSAPKPNVKEKSNNTILYCIIGGVLLAIAAIGTIIVINKKCKKKETFMGETVKEEKDNKPEEKIEHHDEEINETKEESLPEDQNIEKEDEENKEE